jgi:hypothetical protein
MTSDGSLWASRGWSFAHRGLFLLFVCLEEGVGERDDVRVVHGLVLEDLRVDEEEDRHVDLLVSAEPLLLEAEALNLVKIETLGGSGEDRAEEEE